MNAAQEEALQKMVDLGREHFNASVIIVEFDADNDGNKSGARHAYSGGFTNALGLLDIAKTRMLANEHSPAEPSE